MMKIAICDDDVIFTDFLANYLHIFFKQKKVVCPEILIFHTGDQLLNSQDDIDIVFLDIEMPGSSGIAVGNALKERNQHIIIFVVTSFSEYLDDAMRFHVFRYLSKPLEKHRLFRNMNEALQVYYSSNVKISIELSDTVYSVVTSEIIFIEAVDRKTVVHTVSADYPSVRTISEWTSILPQNLFFQSHRSFIVNFMYITDFDHTLIHLYEHQFSAYLARRRYTEFKKVYFLYLESTR